MILKFRKLDLLKISGEAVLNILSPIKSAIGAILPTNQMDWSRNCEKRSFALTYFFPHVLFQIFLVPHSTTILGLKFSEW